MSALNEYGRLTRVALRHPQDAFRDASFVDTSWRALRYRAAPDFARAVDEFEAFAAILESQGIRIEYLPASPDLSLDSIYVRDATIMTPRGMASCRMSKQARSHEPAIAQDSYRAKQVAVVNGIDSGTLEGGDIVWFDEHTVAVADGYRTDPAGIAALRSLVTDDVDVVVCPLPHHKGADDVFHLMSILSPLDSDLALVYSPLMPVCFRRFLLSRGITLIETPENEFDAQGCNVLALAPRRCLMLDGLPETRARLQAAGCDVLTFVGREISYKGDGGPTCLTRPLERAA